MRHDGPEAFQSAPTPTPTPLTTPTPPTTPTTPSRPTTPGHPTAGTPGTKSGATGAGVAASVTRKATPLDPQRRSRGLAALAPRTQGTRRKAPVVRAEALEFATDLRRSPSREALEVIVHRSGCLLPEDQAIMDACYSRGMQVSEIARLKGIDARVVQRRIKRLSARVISAEFAFVLSQENSWPPTRRRVARAVIIEGRTIRAAAKALGLSLHRVREHVHLIHALLNERVAQHVRR